MRIVTLLLTGRMRTNKKQIFSLKDRIKSFTYAFSGLKNLWQEEHNFRIHIFAAILAIVAGVIFNISVIEWLAVILSVGLVLTAEIINTSIEKLSGFVSPEKHETIKKVKDLAAAGVLVAATSALITGLIIFLPKLLTLLSLNIEL